VPVVLSDFFCGWTQPLAAELGVPRFACASSAVYVTVVLHSLLHWMLLPRHENEDDNGSQILFPDIPGTLAYP
jgi:hypothetical protein